MIPLEKNILPAFDESIFPVQVAALSVRNHYLMCALVSELSALLPTSSRNSKRERVGDSSHNDLPLVQEYSPEIDKRSRRLYLKPTNDSWRVDETYIKVKGSGRYLYRLCCKNFLRSEKLLGNRVFLCNHFKDLMPKLDSFSDISFLYFFNLSLSHHIRQWQVTIFLLEM